MGCPCLQGPGEGNPVSIVAQMERSGQGKRGIGKKRRETEGRKLGRTGRKLRGGGGAGRSESWALVKRAPLQG